MRSTGRQGFGAEVTVLHPCLSAQLILVYIVLKDSLLFLTVLYLTMNAAVRVHVSFRRAAPVALLAPPLRALLGSWLPHKIESVGTSSHRHNLANVSTSHDCPLPLVR